MFTFSVVVMSTEINVKDKGHSWTGLVAAGLPSVLW
jgi:hypothetical protein